MSAPEVVLVKRAAWTSECHHVHETFEIRGGDVAPEWAAMLRPPAAPWCTVTVWDEEPQIGGYGGEVWPSAWPELFRFEGPRGREATMLTDAGIAAFEAARQAVRS